MKKVFFMIIVLFSFSFAGELKIGQKSPGTNLFLKNVDGNNLTLKQLKKENGILVIFSCNTCPWVVRWQDRYNSLAKLCSLNDIGFVAVNSNARLHNSVDSFDEMIYHAAVNDYQFPYVLDKNAELAKLFGAMKTPHVYLFNKNDILVYRGAIDDNAKDANKVKKKYLEDAIISSSKEEKIKVETTKALGCSIKF
tara:strand:+ start:612 stop:1196 length:585 start_codon:yes stop_codon:yes gene_type:complete